MEFSFIINKNAAKAQDMGIDRLRSMIKDIYNITDNDLLFFDPNDSDHVEGFIKDHDGNHFLVGGGDGTILYYAEKALKEKITKPFGILPLGTMNLFAQSLNIPLNLQDALKAYKGFEIVRTDVGQVGDHYFLCCAALGLVPELSKIREDNREQGLLSAFPAMSEQALQGLEDSKANSFDMTYENQTKAHKANTIIISNHYYNGDSGGIFTGIKGSKYDDGQMYTYMIRPENLTETVMFLARLGLGAWTESPSITTLKEDRLTIETTKDKEFLSLDGEIFEISTPLEFKSHHKALNILKPGTA